MELVINKCFGGFGLSRDAQLALVGKCEHVKLLEPSEYYGEDWQQQVAEAVERDKDGTHYIHFHDGKVVDDDHRSDPARGCPELVRVVRELGSEKASGQCARLAIVKIPDGVEWEISEYDGREHVAEKHATWG